MASASPPDLLVWAVGALAEGLGIRAVARVFEVDPNTVLAWLVEAADHLQAFSQYFLHDVRVTQVQLDELYALLRAVKAGEVSEAEALQRLARSPRWVWVAHRPGDQAAPGARRRRPHAGHGAARGPSGGAGAGAGLCAALPDRRLQGVRHRAADALRPVGAAGTPAGHRPCAQAALDAAARSCSMRR